MSIIKTLKEAFLRREIRTTSATRSDLTKIVAAFKADPSSAAPVFFGSHRKPEAVIMPFHLYEALIDELEDFADAKLVEERMKDYPQGWITQSFEEFDAQMREIIAKKQAFEGANNQETPEN